MRTTFAVACALTAFVAISGATAEATGLIHTSGIAKGAVTFNRLSPGVQKIVKKMPRNGANGHDGLPGAQGATGATGAVGANGPAGPQGAQGTQGPQGLKGLTGLTGQAGTAGQQGVAGIPGADGAQGPKGDNGAKGDPGVNGKDGKDGVDAPAAEYGVGTVNVKRGAGNPSAWATYSVRLGSPVGSTTGGTFRFTCSTANAPCAVAVKAAVLSSATGNVNVYPRVLISRQDYDNGGPTSYCEYGDGSTGAGVFAVAKQASTATPAYTAMPINIGGSADCGGPDASAGDVTQITVPSGYYDVQSTFLFLP